MRLTAAARAALALLLGACASIGDPPGGPPDTTPPTVAAVAPDSGSVAPPPNVAVVFLDEVVAERVAAPRPDISSAVFLSPVHGAVDVTWRRNRISVRPHEGFKPGRVYRLELLPVLVDLRQNRMKKGTISVFSTGPEIPTATLAGTVVDWPGAHAGSGALIEAVLVHDSLPYRTLADSSGSFVLRQIPAGEYVLYGIIDLDNDHARGPREAFDTVRVHLEDTASVEVYAFAHDTTGPRLRTVEILDSLTLRLTFDRPLDPAQSLDSAAVRFATAADSTTPLGVLHVWTPAQSDSVRAAAQAVRAAADSARARLRADSLRARQPADSLRARPPADSLRARPQPDSAGGRARLARPAPTPAAPVVTAPPPLQEQPPAPRAGAPSAARPGQPLRPADSTLAMKLLARRPPPTAVRLVALAAPLTKGTRYVLQVSGVRDLSRVEADVRGQLAVPNPRPPARPPRRPTPADSLRTPADSAREAAGQAPPADATRRTAPPPAPAPPRDTTRVPPPGNGREPEGATR